jgi:hypothetical protein
MPLSFTDIKFLNSGELGLGGPPTIELGDRLFKDVSEFEVENGKTDYKCIYIQNLNQVDSMFNFSVNATDRNYSNVSIGFPGIYRCDFNCDNFFDFKREEQLLTFTYSSSLTQQCVFDLKYNDKVSTITWDSQHVGNPNHNLYLPCQIKRSIVDPTIFGLISSDCDVCLQTCDTGLDITVQSQDCTGPSCVLTLLLKYPKGKYYDFLVLDTSPKQDLVSFPDSVFLYDPDFSLSSSRIEKGGPINVIADSIENTINIPKFDGMDIDFFDNNEFIVLKELKANEFFPVWVKRQILLSTEKTPEDGFSFNIEAYSTLETTLPPTTSPFITILDQYVQRQTGSIDAVQGKVYWQYFKSGYTGRLTNIELCFSKDSEGSLFGQGHLRIFRGLDNNSSPSPVNIIYSSPISVNITSSGLNWNNYDLNLEISQGQSYIIAYYPKFSHKIMVNNNNCYSCGVSGVDNVPNSSVDYLFKTYIYTNIDDQDSDASLCVCD